VNPANLGGLETRPYVTPTANKKAAA